MSATHESGEFFATAALSQHLDLLHHLIQYSDLLLVVRGPPGAGKTTLLRELLGRAGEGWRISRLDASPDLDEAQLLARLCHDLGLPERDDRQESRLDALKSHLESLQRSQQTALIAIDNADLLAPRPRRLIGDLAAGWEGFNARVVVAQEIGSEALAAEEHTHVIHLPTFSEEQTAAYIASRLASFDLIGDSPFTPAVVRSLHKASGGIPGAINTLMSELIANSRPDPERGRGQSRRKQWWMLLGGALLLTVAIALGVKWWNGVEGGPPVAASLSPPRSATPVQSTIGTPAPTPSETLPAQAPSGAPTAAVVTPPTPAGITAAPTPQASEPPPLANPAPATPPPESPPQTAPAVATPALAIRGAATEPPAVAAGVTSTPPPGAATPAVAPEATPAITREDDVTRADGGAPSTDEAGAQSAPIAASPALPTQPAATPTAPPPEPPAPSVASVRPAIPTPSIAAKLHGINWLRTAPIGAYTLQLMGTHDPEAVTRFVRHNRLKRNVAWFSTRYQDRPWYVVVYGRYPNKAKARAAIKKLSRPLRKGRPWPREIAGILSSAN